MEHCALQHQSPLFYHYAATMSNENSSAVAFVLALAAGAATAIGAAIVFFLKLVKLASRRALAAGLGVAAGVMLYVSLVDVCGKAIDGFVEEGHEDGKAFIYATLIFFGGIFLMMFINEVIIGQLLVRKLGGTDVENVQNYEAQELEASNPVVQREESALSTGPEENTRKPMRVEQHNRVNYMAEQMQRQNSSATDADEPSDVEQAPAERPDAIKLYDDPEAAALWKMSLATGAAITLHNFPEGLVTYVACMADATVGIVLCIGIALHNIPEGVVVAMPMHHATGKRFKAFCWGTLSGVSEPLGALLGWAALESSGFSGNAYGVLFGLVAGIMTYTSIQELLPTALSYDPKNTLVTYTVIFGMVVVAASLMIFNT